MNSKGWCRRLVTVLSFLYVWGAQAHAGAVALGQLLPNVPMTGLNGSQGNLKTYRGRPLLNVWASWCVPCRQEMAAGLRCQMAYRNMT